MTGSDDLLRELAGVARARDAELLDDPRYEALVRGELSDEERRALSISAEGSPDIAFASEVFSPLSAEAEARAIARFTQTCVKGPAPIPIRPPKRRALWAGASLSLAAAAILLLVFRTTPGSSPLPMPTYSVEVSGGSAPKLLGPSDVAEGPLELTREARLSLTLRPQTAVQGDLAALAFLRRGEETAPLSLPLTLNDKGVVSLKGVVADLFPNEAPGRAELVVVIGRPDRIPRDASGLRALETRGGEAEPGIVVGRVDLLLVGEGAR